MSKLYRSILLLTLLALFGLSATASAGVLHFTYTYTGNGTASAGLLTTTDVLVGGAYAITDIQGTRNAGDIDSLLPAGAFGANDNLLFPGGPFVDVPGFSYQSAGLSYNVANGALGCGSASEFVETATGFCPGTGITLTVAPFDPTSGLAYFAYSYVGDGIASAGILTANNSTAGGAYTIDGIQGLRNGVPISSLLPAGAFGANDNLLFPDRPFVDVPGISYQVGGLNFNIANGALGCGGSSENVESATGFCPGSAIAMNVKQLNVPEPASLLLLVAGLAGLGFKTRRKAIEA